MSSKDKSRWQGIASQAAARTFDKYDQPTILTRRVHDVSLVMASLPADQSAIIRGLRDRLRAAGIRELAHASHPDGPSDRQGHAVVLRTTGEEWKLVEAMIANAQLKLAI